MNHIYRLVWCKSRNALVAASELSSRSHGGISVSPGRLKTARLISLAMLGAGSLIYATGAFAQSTTGSAQLDDLQSLVSKYQAPVVGSSAASGVADVAGAPVTVVRQAVSSTLSTVQPVQVDVHASATPANLHANAHVSASLAQAGAGVRIDRHGARIGAGVGLHPAVVGSAVSGVAQATAGVPVVGKVLSGAGSTVSAVTSAVPTVRAGLGATVQASSLIEPIVADRRRDSVVSSLAHSLGIADGTGGGVPPARVVAGDVAGDVSKVPVVGTTVAQVGSALGNTSAGGHDLGTALGTVVGGVVNTAGKLPVLGSTVASVGQNLKGVTSGGSAGGGVVGGQLGEVVGSAVNALSATPGVGKVVAAVGTTLQETTAQIDTTGSSGNGGVGNLTGVVGQVVDGVAGATSKVPVVGTVVGDVGQTLGSVTSGNGSGGLGNLTGTVGQVVDGVAGATSKVPVVGTVVGDVGQTLGSVTSGNGNGGLGNLAGTAGQVVDGVASATSKVPVVGTTVGDVGQALGSVTSGSGSGGLGNLTGTVGQVADGVASTTSQVPVVGTTVAQVGSVLGNTSAGGHDLGTALGTVVGGVVNNAGKLPVLGSTVASVGQNLKGVTSGGSAGGGVVGGQLGEVVGSAVNALSTTPGVGNVVAAVGTTLQETTAQIDTSGSSGGGVDGLTGVAGQVAGGVADATSSVPVVGQVTSQLSGVLGSSTGNGNALGAVGQLVDGVADATSTVPVVGSVTSQLGSALSGVTSSSQGGLLTSLLGSSTSTTPASSSGVPTVPPPSDTPSGVIVGNGGVVGSVSALLGSSTNALFGNNSTDGYITDGSLKVSTANFTQGYSTVNALGIPVINSTPVGTVLTTVGGTVLGSTGENSNLTLIGGVTSDSYITNINNGETNSGLLGLVLPGSAPAWASTCLNVLGVVKESCWAVNAAQNNQVLVGDGASANGSEEVVIGTNASHTLPSVTACSVFTGNGTATDPCGVPDADYEAREGHSVVIGDSASGTANAQTILGANATSDVANSVALGYGSVADRGAQSNYTAYGLSTPQNSAGEVSIGSPGQERQITNVAAGSAATDAVNVAQLEGVAATADNAVQYDNANKTSVTLGGPASTDGGVTGGTTITNLHQGALSATSTDAVNGSQLFATNQSLATYMGGTTSYNPATNTWTAPTFNITSVAVDGSTTQGSYDNVTSAFDAVNGSLDNLNTHINNIDNSAAIKYYQVNSSLADSQATGTNSLAAGPGATASADNSMAVGESATASGANSMAVGFGAVASSDNALAVGENATAQDGNAVAIGYGNTASGDGAVALGDPNTATGQGAVAIGYDSTATGQSAVALGSTATANGASALAMGDTASATANNAIAFGANATANFANSIALGAGSVTTVGALTDYQAYGLTAPQTSSGEVNVGNRQITGVAAGSAADDAVNVAQLEAVSAQSSSTDKLAVKYDADSSGDPTNTVTLTGDGSGAQVLVTNLAAGAETATSTDAVNGSQLWHWTQDTSNIYSNYSLYNDIQNIQNGGGGGGTVKYFSVNSTLANSSATGSNSIAIGPQATSSGTNSVAMGNGASATADNSVAIGAGSVADRANTVSVGSAGNARQITNVAAGTEATDAVNVGQLDSAISSSTQGTVHYDTNSDGSIDYSSVTLGDGTGSTAIHNVAAGTAPTDAANVGQVQQAMDWSQNYTDQRFNQAESDIQTVNNRANAGVAAAMAAAGLPQAYEPGKSMAAMAGGSFRGESSLAIGVSTISEGGRWVYKVNGSADSRGDAAVSVGAGIQW